MARFTNVALYKFTPLDDLKPLRDRLLGRCREGNLKGSVLLSTEGINLFVAGLQPGLDRLLTELRAVPNLGELDPKLSYSDEQPFTRMLVKIKKEIIAFGVPGIDPARRPSPRVSPRELKRWLDEGRPVTLLDTRNNFEVDLGTFRNARAIGVGHFREFPHAADALPDELKSRPVVTFCTGGIRCEKAAPYLERLGFEQVFQLDGGILKYFEECGRDHYDGECFVFDKRVGLDPSLQESDTALCFVCQSPLGEADRRDPRYVEGVSCAHCVRSDEERRRAGMAHHEKLLREVTTPLPGDAPYENVRPLVVPRRWANASLVEYLHGILGHISIEHWRTECDAGRVLGRDHRPVTAEHVVKDGDRYFHLQPRAAEPAVNADIRILHEDEAIVVLNKPAPLPMHPCGQFNKNSLQMILRQVYAPQRPRPAHRLDANTTGVVVFTRTAHFAKLVQPQFERGEVEKQYLARVVGHSPADEFTCDAPIQESATEAGSRGVQEDGLSARTDFRVLRGFEDGTTLLEVTPRTGRTNQIRVHLWYLGFPIVGDPMYRPNGERADKQTLDVSDPPMCLHAHRLTFTHPVRNERVTFEADPPEWVTRG
jgi:RluA family pseudouridine synthase